MRRLSTMDDELRGGDGSGPWDTAEHRGWTIRENRDLTALAADGVSGFATSSGVNAFPGDDEDAVDEDQQRSPQQEVEGDLQPGWGAPMVGVVFPDAGHQGRHPGCDGNRDHADSVIIRPASCTGFGPRGTRPWDCRSGRVVVYLDRGCQYQ